MEFKSVGRMEIPYMKWKRKCSKPPTSISIVCFLAWKSGTDTSAIPRLDHNCVASTSAVWGFQMVVTHDGRNANIPEYYC